MKTIVLNGYEFKMTGSGTIPLEDLASLYLVFMAIDGDELAQRLLNDANKTVKDADGVCLWPPEKKE